jgi:hypothetical protein
MRRALVVGINEYPNARLNGCVPDAERIAALLANHHDGTPNFDVQTILVDSGGPTLKKSCLKEAITTLLQQPASLALLYFSGHGTSTEMGGYLVTPDATAYDEGVSMAEVLTLVNNSPVGEVVVLLDCCHSGLFGKLPGATNKQLVLRDDACLMVASRGEEAAMETAKGGVFTQLVCDALEGGGADPLGRVTAAAMYAYVDQSLSAWDQRPLFKANLSCFEVLRHVEPMVAPSIIRLLPSYFPEADHEYSLDPSYEPTEEPSNEQNERTFKDFQQLRDAHLLVPVGEEHLYYAAVRSTACKLTLRGQFYWRLAKANRV